MRITKVEIERFRSLYSINFNASPLTPICGPNSCGKSNILRALRFAFLPEYSGDRMPDNICYDAVGGNTQCGVKLTFDSPTPALAAILGLPTAQTFTYKVSVKRNGKQSSYINGVQLTNDKRQQLLSEMVIIHVPPIRDISAEGLRPFKDTLSSALKKTRGDDGYARLNQKVRNLIKDHGNSLLDGSTRGVAKNMLRVDELTVNSDKIDLEHLFPATRLSVRIKNNEIDLDKLGTGHQSSVILQLYRQLGANSNKFVLYLFEEPDNHLHPTSLRAISDDLLEISKENDSQVFLTTHSPYLLNQFNHQHIIALSTDSKRHTIQRSKSISRTDREVRIALGKYGLKPAEALLANKVVVVEGPNDVTLLRTIMELHTGVTPDRQDILIVPAGGKDSVADLAGFLKELGANWCAFFDWDAAESTSVPLFKSGLRATDVPQLQDAANLIRDNLKNLPTRNSKATKIINAMLSELAHPLIAPTGVFSGSILDSFAHDNSLLNTDETKTLTNAIARKQRATARQILATKNVWLWGGCIEEVLLRSEDCEIDAEAALRARGVFNRNFQSQEERRNTLLKHLHNSAHEPDLMRAVIESLWNAGRFDHSELKKACKFILG